MGDVKHTPGPWDISEYKDGHAFVFDPDMGFVCNVMTGSSEGVANARLIAAAPDMLKALKRMVDWFEQDNPDPAYDELMLARAAIAKAEGHPTHD